MIAIAHGAGLQVGHVRAAAGLGDRQGADLLPGQHQRCDSLAQFGAGPFDDGRQADIQGAEARHQAAGATAHQLLASGDLGEQITLMAAAQGLGVTDAQKPGGPGLEVQLTGETAGLLPLVDLGKDFTLDETSHAVADQLLSLIHI